MLHDRDDNAALNLGTLSCGQQIQYYAILREAFEKVTPISTGSPPGSRVGACKELGAGKVRLRR